MLVKLVGFSQDMDFEDGSVTNFATLALPNGTTVKAIISDEGARLLVEARTALGGFTAPEPPPRTATPAPTDVQQPFPTTPGDEEEYDEGGAKVFGGTDTQQGATSQPVWMNPTTEEIREPAPAAPSGPNLLHSSDPVVQQKAYQQQQVDIRKRAKQGPTMGRTVQKDAFGYPIVPVKAGTADPREVLGGGSDATADEDGVRQF